MINLYDEFATDFSKNGLATLNPISAEFSVNINGAWQLTVVLPYDKDNKYLKVEKSCLLCVDLLCIREQSSRQLFRIYDIKRELKFMTIIAFPIGMEATYDAPIEELNIPDASGVDAALLIDSYVQRRNFAPNPSKYTVRSEVAKVARTQFENTNLIAAISGSDERSFVNNWGGEVLYDNLSITIKNKLGNQDNKFPVVYGRNLTGMNYDLDMSSVITRAFLISDDGLRLHDYSDIDMEYWYGTFDSEGQRKNYAKSTDNYPWSGYMYSWNDRTWYQFNADGKLLTDPISEETLAILNTFDWHEDETGWYYGDGVSGSGNFVANGWVEDASGKHYWMDQDGYMDDQWTDSDIWNWFQYNITDKGYADGESRNTFVDSKHIGDYPYKRAAFLETEFELVDTSTKSMSITALSTRQWKSEMTNAVYSAAQALWDLATKDQTNAYNADYLQDLISGDGSIIEYTQARYAYSHKGWQSLVKSCIKTGIDWIDDVDLPDEGWIEVNGWMYGDFDSSGNFRNYAKNQYIYSYDNSKWYWFDEGGLMSTDEIPAEKLVELNAYTWHTDEQGRQWYGLDSDHYMKSAWVENSDGSHSWVDADGYYDAQWDDSDTWEWTEINGWKYGDSVTHFAVNKYVEIDKKLEWFGGDGFWRDWEAVDATEMDWYQEKEGVNKDKWWYGSVGRNYAHNEYVYMTVDGTMMEWWYDEEGWYDEDQSGESEYAWHGDATSGYWFGTVDSETGEADNYIHDKWAFIDGTYYWFDADGYISGDASKAKQDWAWGNQTDDVTGKEWFGNTDESFNRIYISNQWLKVDGTWYYFDSDGYMVDPSAKESQTKIWFSDAVWNTLTPVSKAKLKEAYDLLYTQMKGWIKNQYDNGLDMPRVTVEVNLVDLSKTTEYAGYSFLEKTYLGDKVKCIDAKHGIEYGTEVEARIVGLTHDVIRGYNTNVTIGQLSKSLSSILGVNFQSAAAGQKLIPGDGINIDGNVISVDDGNNGTSYGQQDTTYQGRSLLNGNVAVLDDVIPEVTEVVANPEGTATAELTKLQVGNGIYSIPEGGGGLEYWEETSDQFYREYEIPGMSADTGYIFTNQEEWKCWSYGYGRVYFGSFAFKKLNDIPAIIVAVGTTYPESTQFFLISTDESATKWRYKSLYATMDWTDPTGGSNTDTTRGSADGSVTDNSGATWYYSRGLFGSTGRGPVPDYEFNGIEGSSWSSTDAEWVEYILGISNASPTTTVKVGLGKDGKILYQKVGEDYVAYLDDTGAFEGTDYKVNGESLVTKINAKQDKLIQGTNITIGADGKTISATDTDEVSELTDVELTDLADGQILKWDAANSKWINDDESGGSGNLTAVELTYAQWQALTPAEKDDATKQYFVSGVPESGLPLTIVNGELCIIYEE